MAKKIKYFMKLKINEFYIKYLINYKNKKTFSIYLFQFFSEYGCNFFN